MITDDGYGGHREETVSSA